MFYQARAGSRTRAPPRKVQALSAFALTPCAHPSRLALWEGMGSGVVPVATRERRAPGKLQPHHCPRAAPRPGASHLRPGPSPHDGRPPPVTTQRRQCGYRPALVRSTAHTAPRAPAIRRAYWEKVNGEYTWHGGDEQPPEGYVKLNESQRGNPNNKKKLYDVYGPAPTPRKKKPKKKGDPGGTSTAPPQIAEGGAKKPLNKGDATNQAKQAPALMETAETQALESATQMQKAVTPELAVAAAEAAQVSRGQGRGSGGQARRPGPEGGRLPRNRRRRALSTRPSAQYRPPRPPRSSPPRPPDWPSWDHGDRYRGPDLLATCPGHRGPEGTGRRRRPLRPGPAGGCLQAPGGHSTCRPLPRRTFYATQVVLTQLAVLAQDGASATRMAEIIVAEPTLPTTTLSN